MSGGIERCPSCVVWPLAARTNQQGHVYLECDDCGHVEPVQRKPDPFPTQYREVIDCNGVKRRRSTASVATSYRKASGLNLSRQPFTITDRSKRT